MSGSQSIGPGPAASAGSLFEMHVLRPHPRTAELETLGAAPSSLVLETPQGTEMRDPALP